MHGPLLRRLRIFSALIVFLFSALLFLDLRQLLPVDLFQPLRYIQFVPALQLALGFSLGGIMAFLAMLLLTLLFGRVYCSFLCPLGILQDVLGRTRKLFRKRRRYRRQPVLKTWRYAFLLLFLLAFFAGSGWIIGLLDPYSWFGRIAVNLMKPVLILVNNTIAWVFNASGSYALSPVKFHGISWASAGAALGIFGLLVVLVWKNGRIFCNSVCPVGTALGMLSGKAILKIHFQSEACTSCGLCSAECKAGCIDLKVKTVDHSRCVACFNCLPACSEGGLYFGRPPALPTDLSRRDLLVRAGSTIVLPAVLKEASEEDKARATRRAPITPPGSLSRTHLSEYCTACHLCVSACPTGVLQPSLLEYGWFGLMQPVMDPITGYCNYDCVRCIEVCPTGAITRLSVEEKKKVQIGRARFIEELCVVTKDNTACGACSEHCPTKAVNMIPWKGRLTIPNVDNTICVGCGACEYACPTTPRSIVVDGNPIHRIAEMPRNTGEKAEEAVMEEFPF
jgi:polyferredoxin